MNQLFLGTGSNSISSFKGLVLTTPKNKKCKVSSFFLSPPFFIYLMMRRMFYLFHQMSGTGQTH